MTRHFNYIDWNANTAKYLLLWRTSRNVSSLWTNKLQGINYLPELPWAMLQTVCRGDNNICIETIHIETIKEKPAGRGRPKLMLQPTPLLNPSFATIAAKKITSLPIVLMRKISSEFQQKTVQQRLKVGWLPRPIPPRMTMPLYAQQELLIMLIIQQTYN